jgi:hypothetical protein
MADYNFTPEGCLAMMREAAPGPDRLSNRL